MSHEIDVTPRGLRIYAKFIDSYDQPFSVQESSVATDARLWVGTDKRRGHLTIEQARETRDAITGWLQDVGAEHEPTVDRERLVAADALREAAEDFLAASRAGIEPVLNRSAATLLLKRAENIEHAGDQEQAEPVPGALEALSGLTIRRREADDE